MNHMNKLLLTIIDEPDNCRRMVRCNVWRRVETGTVYLGQTCVKRDDPRITVTGNTGVKRLQTNCYIAWLYSWNFVLNCLLGRWKKRRPSAYDIH